MEMNTMMVTDLGYVIDRIADRVMGLIETANRQEVLRHKAEIEPVYYSRREAAEKLRISLSALHTRVNKGDIPSYKIGGRTLFKANEINSSLIRKR